MPKRGGRSRGGGRGGARGGGRGGTRGGGSFRNFNLSKSLKRRANKNKSAAHGNQDVPELMDLGGDGYLPVVGSSMSSLSKRPNRRMMHEAQYTDKHMEETMNQPLRYRRIEFVKAKDVYDPGKELRELLNKYQQKDELALEMENLKVEPRVPEITPVPEISNTENDKVLVQKSVELPQEALAEEILPKFEKETLAETPVETSPSDVPDELTRRSEEEPAPIHNSPISEDRLDSLSNQPIEEDAIIIDVAPSHDLDMAVDPVTETGDADEDVETYTDEESDTQIPQGCIEDFFTIDETGDNDIFEKHAVQKKSTASLLKGNRPKRAPAKPIVVAEEIPATEYDSYLMVGNVMLKTLTDEFGNMSTNLPRTGRSTHGSMNLMEPGSYYEEESEDTDEEAAFEDYKAQIMGDLNFGDEDSDEDDLMEEFADLDDGESFVYGDTENSENEQDFDDYDVYVSSDDGGSDIGEEYLNSEEEGLEDILDFARKQQKVKQTFDMAPTETLKKKGKGKKLRLELGSHLELELRESLMEQFEYQRQSKRDKKLRKKEKRQREGIELHDLNIKYDYSLHIQEIKQEFETFLHDAARETMSFPPLDGHGNKTINKLAGHYNMKCIRCGGNGLTLFMKVAKTKKTFRYIPAYDQIGYIMKQRPVFRRVDVKPRTKEEIAETDGKKDRNGPKNTAVVREGDIVGGEAPEIGNNNIGRLLLERLGWVKGEGLGALGNKGISEPLTATVKRSKTGLK